MSKPSSWQRFAAFIMQSRQIMIIDHKTHKATRNRRFYPMIFWPVVLLLLLALASTFFIAGNYYKPFWQQQDIRPQYMQLQRLYQDVRVQINDTVTQLGIRDEQVNMLNEEIKAQQNKVGQLEERLHLYDSLLIARKGEKLQILQFKVKTVSDKVFELELALVRGGTTPHWVSGWLKFFALNNKGKKIPLLLSNSKYKLPYRIESHTFLHQTARWLQSSPAGETVYAHVYNSKGKLLLEKSFSLDDGENKKDVKKTLK